MYLHYAAVTDRGAVREENQDSLLVDGILTSRSKAMLRGRYANIATLDRPLVFGVVDGMGGYAGGLDAAALVSWRLAGIAHEMGSEEWQAWLAGLSEDVGSVGRAIGKPMMGAAMALLSFGPDRFTAVNVGDCRSYRMLDDTFVQISVDDTMPGSSALTQSIGGGRNARGRTRQLDAHYKHLPYAAMARRPERIVLCSDGLYGTIEHQELASLLAAHSDVNTACDDIMALARERHPVDNLTLIIVEVGLEP